MSDATPALRAGTIGRVSQDTSGEERSITEQQDENRAECDANGWRVAAEYEDAVGASRFTRKQREDWPRLQADIEADRLDVVVMWEPSRGSREPEDWFAFLRRCREHRVRIHVTTHNRTYDVSNERDWRSLAEDGVDSAYEVEKLSRRVKRGLAANRANGKPHGRILYGYERVYGIPEGRKRKPKLIEQRPHPERSAMAAEIIRRLAQAEPVSVVQADLNRRGVPSATGGLWTRHQVRSLALNPAYIGKLRDGGELVDAVWPAIVDDATFEATFWAAHALLTAPERKTMRPGKAKWLLSYIAACGVCGASIWVQGPSDRHRFHRYMCSSNRRCVSVSMAEADDFIERLIIARCARPDFYGHLVQGSDAAVVEARNEAARLRAQLDEWAAADISARAYQIKEAKLLPLIGAADRRADQLAVPSVLRGLAEPGANVVGRWKAMVVAARREAVRAVFTSLVLQPGRAPAHERIGVEWRKKLDDET